MSPVARSVRNRRFGGKGARGSRTRTGPDTVTNQELESAIDPIVPVEESRAVDVLATWRQTRTAAPAVCENWNGEVGCENWTFEGTRSTLFKTLNIP